MAKGSSNKPVSAVATKATQQGHYEVKFEPKSFFDKYSPNYLLRQAVEFTQNITGVDADTAKKYNSAVNGFTDRMYILTKTRKKRDEIWRRGTAEGQRQLLHRRTPSF